jgi:hypothetical protein
MPVFEVSYHLGGSMQSGLQIVKDDIIADSLPCAIKAVSDFINASDPAPLIVEKGMSAYIVPKSHIITAKVVAKPNSGASAEATVSGQNKNEEFMAVSQSEPGQA